MYSRSVEPFVKNTFACTLKPLITLIVYCTVGKWSNIDVTGCCVFLLVWWIEKDFQHKVEYVLYSMIRYN